jgi:putative N6-adenine-specific DNA methylase
MTAAQPFEIFAVAPPGLESALAAEIAELGFSQPRAEPGGVSFTGGWPEVWRANLRLSGATRVLARFARFRAAHLSELDKKARKLPWGEVLPAGARVEVEAVCRKSRIYHSGAASQRIAGAVEATLGAASAEAPAIGVKARIERDMCTISFDTSGEPLHKRGWKPAVAKAPMRETLAALFLREAGYSGAEPVLDPMCGSGTFVIEAALRASGLAPGRLRRFAFEAFNGFDDAAWAAMRAETPGGAAESLGFYGFDRDAGAVRAAAENAARAGVGHVVKIERRPVAGLVRPDGPAGLVIVNPPYGARIGDPRPLQVLHRTLGERLRREFSGWRAAIVTSDARLARATGLAFARESAPVDHGGLKVRLHVTGRLD